MSKFKYNVLDVETTIKNGGEESVGSFKAAPFHPDNHIVLLGEKSHANSDVVVTDSSRVTQPAHEHDFTWGDTLIVGHNIGFDLLYLRKDMPSWKKAWRNCMIWDTMIVHYLLTGQSEKFASLDALSSKAGGTLKDDKIKKYWEAGVQTEKIPHYELKDYLIHDVENTEKVFLQQFELAAELDMLPLIHCQMEARMATIEMEWNGVHVDRAGLNVAAEALKNEIGLVNSEMQEEMERAFDLPDAARLEVNPCSPKQLSTYLFGGTLVFSLPEPILDSDGKPVLYKSGNKAGQPRFSLKSNTKVVKGILSYPPSAYGTGRGATGSCSTGDAVLQKILEVEAAEKHVIRFVKLALKSRTMSKDYGAFYDGYSKLLWHDDCLHPHFNHCSTNTGRLSCSGPNLQQVSGK